MSLPKVETRPIRDNELEVGRLDQYIFFIGTESVGFMAADCCVCAWKDGKRRFPGAQMAHAWSWQLEKHSWETRVLF